uniref:Ig-like domain-containing protein n=1 Tax=Oreochromis aureus TaxID=47969 RepID=A0AAZ1WXV0_OREAU
MTGGAEKTPDRNFFTEKISSYSKGELQQGTATITCLANKGGWQWQHQLGGEQEPVVLQNDGLYSWSSTLRLPADRWMKVGSVTCEATQGCQTLVSEPLRRVQCSQS